MKTTRRLVIAGCARRHTWQAVESSGEQSRRVVSPSCCPECEERWVSLSRVPDADEELLLAQVCIGISAALAFTFLLLGLNGLWRGW